MPTTKKRIIHTITDWDMDAGEWNLDVDYQVKDWESRQILYPRLVSHGSKKYYHTNNIRAGGWPYDRYTVTSSTTIPYNYPHFAPRTNWGGIATFEARTPELAWHYVNLPNGTWVDGDFVSYNQGTSYSMNDPGVSSALVGAVMAPKTDPWGDGYDVWVGRVFLHFSKPANTALFGEITGMKLWLPVLGGTDTYNYATEESIGIFLQPNIPTLSRDGIQFEPVGTLITTIPSFSFDGVGGIYGGIKLEIDMPIIDDASFTLLLERVDPTALPPMDDAMSGSTYKASIPFMLGSSNDCYPYMTYKYDTSVWEAEQY